LVGSYKSEAQLQKKVIQAIDFDVGQLGKPATVGTKSVPKRVYRDESASPQLQVGYIKPTFKRISGGRLDNNGGLTLTNTGTQPVHQVVINLIFPEERLYVATLAQIEPGKTESRSLFSLPSWVSHAVRESVTVELRWLSDGDIHSHAYQVPTW
jgi:hypothetical protein